jgi:hypothetical protein
LCSLAESFRGFSEWFGSIVGPFSEVAKALVNLLNNSSILLNDSLALLSDSAKLTNRSPQLLNDPKG